MPGHASCKGPTLDDISVGTGVVIILLTDVQHFLVIRVSCMIIECLGTMGKGRCSDHGRHSIEIGPKHFQNLPDGYSTAGDERCGVAEEAFIFVSMDMEKANGSVKNHVWELIVEPPPEMDKVLADDIINQHGTLCWVQITS